MRRKLGFAFIVAALVALVIPAASADICNGPCGTGGGSTGGGTTTPFNRISISNGGPGPSAAQAVDEPEGEGSSTCQLTIHRLKPRKGNTTVSFHTKNGTATSSSQGQNPPDYESNEGTVTFSPEQPSAIPVHVFINQDFLAAPNPNEAEFENFFVVLTNPQNGVIIDNSGKCIIHDTSRGGE